MEDHDGDEQVPVLLCHWYNVVPEPPVTTTDIGWVSPEQMVAPTGWVSMTGSTETVTVIQLDVIGPQPAPVCDTTQ